MTLDEAIKRAEDVAEEKEKEGKLLYESEAASIGCLKCEEEHRQLAKWLKELKAYKEQSCYTISRQAALDAMYALCDTGETLKDNPWRDNPHIDAIIDALENLQPVTPQQTRWIPVSEALPEEGVDVLACFYTGEKNYKMMVSRRSDCNYWNGVGRTSDMVEWMPLPEPYKAESAG